MLKKLKSKSFKNILSKVYAWKWPTQCITEWLSKKQSENEIVIIIFTLLLLFIAIGFHTTVCECGLDKLSVRINGWWLI